jgi:hypothetical protein
MSNRPIPWFEKMAMAKGKYFELCVRSQKHYRAPEWSRTIDLQNRNLSLYPAELCGPKHESGHSDIMPWDQASVVVEPVDQIFRP